ncbi:MAG: hypothetical protein JWN44_2763 [Myxococcales bacterium]|nr:hypothetical protein [Myxococcales bacterium]
MNPISGNLFTILTLIAAPAVLTNASSVLALNTANRFGRVVDRSRQLTLELEAGVADPQMRQARIRQLGRLRRRAAFLLRAQTCFYAALGLFVVAALVSVLGAALGIEHTWGYRVAVLVGFGVGLLAALSLFYGCILLVRETRLALRSLGEETALLEARLSAAGSG